MREYVLSILQKISGQGQPMTDEGIIDWVNQKASFFIMKLINIGNTFNNIK